jgi:hypothetical protein
MWILIGMICILGYSANASAIALEVPVGNEEEMGMEHLAVQAATAFWLVIKLTRGESGSGTDTGSESGAVGWVKEEAGGGWPGGRRGCDDDGRRCTFAQKLDSNPRYEVSGILVVRGLTESHRAVRLGRTI